MPSHYPSLTAVIFDCRWGEYNYSVRLKHGDAFTHTSVLVRTYAEAENVVKKIEGNRNHGDD